jgi:hypothetical protein
MADKELDLRKAILLYKDFTEKIIKLLEQSGNSELAQAVDGLARTYGLFPDVPIIRPITLEHQIYNFLVSHPDNSFRFSELMDLLRHRPARYDDAREALGALKNSGRITMYGKCSGSKYSVNPDLRMVG